MDSVVVVNGRGTALVPFSRDALFISLYESCKHRPKALTDASELTQTIIAALRPTIVDGILERKSIVSATLITLQRFDQVAATMYAAYHPFEKV